MTIQLLREIVEQLNTGLMLARGNDNLFFPMQRVRDKVEAEFKEAQHAERRQA